MFPTLSILFCVNKETPFLKPAIDSILNQTYKEFELLIAADAKSANLVPILEEICAGDPRVQIYKIAIPQLQFCLNYLANIAVGDYFVRMDADDVAVPERLEVLVAAIQKTRPDVIGSWCTLIDENDNQIGVFEPPTDNKAIVRRMMYATSLYHPAVAISKECFFKLRGYAGGPLSEDYDLWLRAIRLGMRMENVPKHLLKYRIHSGQTTGTKVGRAEIVGHEMRELLIQPSFYRFASFVVALGKSVIGPGFTVWSRRVVLGRSGGDHKKANSATPAH